MMIYRINIMIIIKNYKNKIIQMNYKNKNLKKIHSFKKIY